MTENVEIKIRSNESGKTIEFKFNPDDESIETIKSNGKKYLSF